MTFKEIVDMVIADGFDENRRSMVQECVRYRHAMLWDLEEWEFKFATDDVTVTSGSQTVTGVATNLGVVLALLNSSGAPLIAVPEARDFYRSYYNNESSSTGKPEAFTVVGATILVGPTSSETKTDYKLVYQKTHTMLDADNDLTGFPEEYDLALVHGGKAEGFRLIKAPVWEEHENSWDRMLESMRHAHLTRIRAAGTQFAAYRPEQWS